MTLKLLSDIEAARLEFYKNHPEAIKRTLAKRIVAICHRCKGELHLKEKCLHGWVQRRTSVMNNYSSIDCPHCGDIGNVKSSQDNLAREINAIDHSIVEIIEHVISEERVGRWWNKQTVTNSIKEYNVLRTIVNKT